MAPLNVEPGEVFGGSKAVERLPIVTVTANTWEMEGVAASPPLVKISAPGVAGNQPALVDKEI